ncbi:Uncharacterised protein [Bordetella pertussis]|nr:Uncharacterised protein [Bordetella pertussis]CPL70818.1 Uncharacterised protein [Bordetella pertussis]CPM07156.1 Uncharacterised protein [Bordetella pertussis]
MRPAWTWLSTSAGELNEISIWLPSSAGIRSPPPL